MFYYLRLSTTVLAPNCNSLLPNSQTSIIFHSRSNLIHANEVPNTRNFIIHISIPQKNVWIFGNRRAVKKKKFIESNSSSQKKSVITILFLHISHITHQKVKCFNSSPGDHINCYKFSAIFRSFIKFSLLTLLNRFQNIFYAK